LKIVESSHILETAKSNPESEEQNQEKEDQEKLEQLLKV